MTGPVEKARAAGMVARRLRAALLAMLAAFTCAAALADPPAPSRAASLPETDAELDRRAYALLEQNKLAEARDAYTQLAELRRRTAGPQSASLADALGNLGFTQWRLSDYPSAIKTDHETLAIYRKVLPKDHASLGWCLNTLGLVQLDTADYAAARASFEEALSIRRRALPAGHLEIGQTLMNLGITQADLGDNAAARRSYEEALAIRRKGLPKDHLDIAWTLNNLGNTDRDLADYLASARCHSEALGLRRRVLGNENAAVAQSLANLGYTQWSAHDYAGARKNLLEALAIYRKVLPKDHLDLAWCVNLVGLVQVDLGEYAAAKKSYEEVLAIRRRVSPHNDLDIAQTLHNLGIAEADLGNNAAARQCYEEVLVLRRRGLPKNHLDIAWTLNNLGNVDRDLNDFAAAKKCHEEALAMRRRLLGQNNGQVVQSLNNLGLTETAQRDYAAALAHFHQAFEIALKVVPLNEADLAWSLVNVGTGEWNVHEYALALKHYEEGLALRRKALPKDHLDIAYTLDCLGTCQVYLRDYASARKNFEEELAIRRRVLPKDQPDIARSLLNLGNVRFCLDDLAEARKYVEEAVALQRKTLAADRAIGLIFLGLIQWRLSEPSAARKNFLEALEIVRSARPANELAVAACLYSLSLVEGGSGEWAAARKHLEEGLAVLRNSPLKEGPEIGLWLYWQGYLNLASGTDLPTAFRSLEQASALFQQDQLRAALSQAEEEQLGTAGLSHTTLDYLLTAALDVKADPDAVYDRVLAVKGSVTAQQRWARQVRDGADPRTKQLLTRLKHVHAELLRVSLADQRVADASASRELARLVERLSSERAELERELSERSQAYRAARAQSAVRTPQIRAALTPGAALVDLVEYQYVAPGSTPQMLAFERRLLAFVIRPDRPKAVMVPLGAAADFAKLVDGWRASYGTGKLPSERGPDPAAELRKRLWLPLEPEVKGSRVILISPDGALHGLPWAALPGSEPGTYLVRDYAFAIVPTPHLLPEVIREGNRPRPAGEQPSLLLVGGIDFGTGRKADAKTRDARSPGIPLFQPLAGTESEVNDLEKRFRRAFPKAAPAELFDEDRATKGAVVAAAPNHQYIHWATHGYFADASAKSVLVADQRSALLRGGLALRGEAAGRNPALLSGIVFAGINSPDRPPQEAILTALEAAELDLRKTDLLVLSACNTGRGQVAGGEGVLGLQRALQLAGVRAVAASLWQVPDEETHQLMREFYRRVWSDKPVSKAEALRQAQIWMLENWKPRGLDVDKPTGPPSPYVWAAFVLSGDWR